MESSALLRISEDIRRSVSKKKIVIYVSLDTKSAFLSVPHDALIKVCKGYGFSESVIEPLNAIV